jgi:hypothetical protein
MNSADFIANVGAKYLDDAVLRALTHRLERNAHRCGPIDVALAAQSHADLYVLNTPFYNRLADRAIELAGVVVRGGADDAGPDHAADPEQSHPENDRKHPGDHGAWRLRLFIPGTAPPVGRPAER